MPIESFSYANPLKKRFGDEYFRSLPSIPGVYFFMGEGGAHLYIGKAADLKKRLASYLRAKPGRAADHTLEMLELAREIRIERHASGDEALAREAELIRAIRPPFNIAGTDPVPYLYVGIRTSGDEVDFRLTHRRELFAGGFKWYGCYKNRGRVKAGYSALLRLFFAANCRRPRFHFPAEICRASPPYLYSTKLPSIWHELLGRFLAGQDDRLLERVMASLLENENIPPFMYPGIQSDIEIVKEFYWRGPRETLLVGQALGLRRGALITHRRMDDFIARTVPLLSSQDSS